MSFAYFSHFLRCDYSWYQIKRRGELSVGEGLVEAKCYKRRGQIKRRGGSWQGEML